MLNENEKNRKRSSILDEIDKVKRTKSELFLCVELCRKDVEKYDQVEAEDS